MGGTILFLALFAQNYILGQQHKLCENWNFSKQQMKEEYTFENLCSEMYVLEMTAQCVRDKNALRAL